MVWHRRPSAISTRLSERRTLRLDYDLTLGPGESGVVRHELGALLTDDAALSLARELADTLPPELELTAPAGEPVTSSRDVAVAGTVHDDFSPVTVEVNDEPVGVNGDGTFTASARLPDIDGTHEIVVTATDPAGNSREARRQVRLNRDPPPATSVVDGPAAATTESAAVFELGARAGDGGELAPELLPVAFECRLDDGVPAACESPVRFEGLDEGGHRLEVVAIDQSRRA